MEKHKEVFFTIRLHSAQSAASLSPIQVGAFNVKQNKDFLCTVLVHKYMPTSSLQDPDPLMSCDLMDGRDAFLTTAREKHLEFSSLRRCKFSSMVLLYELHTQVSFSRF